MKSIEDSLSVRDKIVHILAWAGTPEYAPTSEAYTYCKGRPHINEFSSSHGELHGWNSDSDLYAIADEIISLINDGNRNKLSENDRIKQDSETAYICSIPGLKDSILQSSKDPIEDFTCSIDEFQKERD